MASKVTIVGLGCEIDRLFAGQPPALPFPAPPERDDIRVLYDAIAGRLDHGDAVIVILGDWLPEDSLRRIQTVHSLLATDRVAIHITDLPPLATSVLAALAAALAPLAPTPGILAGALEAVGAQLHVLAWAGSVAGLAHPSVSLRHHARSLMPRSAFAVGVQPESFVAPLSGGASDVPLTVPEHPVELLVAPTEKADTSWMLKVVAPALGGSLVREMPATLYGEQWWGTSRLVEAVGVPISLQWLAEATLSGAGAPCTWCGEPILAPPCPFCGGALVRGGVARSARSSRSLQEDHPEREEHRADQQEDGRAAGPAAAR